MANITVPVVDNFRSFDGYTTADGHRIRTGMLYRSGKLNELTSEGKEVIHGLGIKTIVDFRNSEELQADPTPEMPGVSIEHIPILGGDLREYLPVLMEGKLTQHEVEQLMCGMYKSLVTECATPYARFFTILLNSTSYPVLFHCSAGKDRTGFASAALLLLLGVNRHDVLKDYLLTNDNLTYLKSSRVFQIIPHAETLLEAKECYLNTALDAIAELYGNIQGYFEKALDILPEDQKKLKSLLLE